MRVLREAIAHYREALKLAPNDAQTRNNLGNILAELGQLDEAATNYVEALRLNLNYEAPKEQLRLLNSAVCK